VSDYTSDTAMWHLAAMHVHALPSLLKRPLPAQLARWGMRGTPGRVHKGRGGGGGCGWSSPPAEWPVRIGRAGAGARWRRQLTDGMKPFSLERVQTGSQTL
jgi:hypothetical protein